MPKLWGRYKIKSKISKFRIPFTKIVVILSKQTVRSYGGRDSSGKAILYNTSHRFAIAFTGLEHYSEDPLKCSQCDI